MSDLLRYVFDGQPVRFIDGLPVGVDVARVLGFKYPDDAVRRVPSKWIKIVMRDELTGSYSTELDYEFKHIAKITVLTEPAIYHLIFRSKLPSAIAFQEWVFEDVLPQIRATGVYVPKPKLEEQKVKALQAAEAADYIRRLLGETQPRLVQVLVDSAISEILGLSATSAIDEPRLTGVAELAEKLGYAVNLSNRSQLGKFCKAQLFEIGITALKEERLVNGTMREVNLYPDCEELRNAIHNFFNQ